MTLQGLLAIGQLEEHDASPPETPVLWWNIFNDGLITSTRHLPPHH